MGTIIPPPPPPPDPVDPGLDCLNCWGSGKPFGDGDTPDKIFVSISGVQKGPSWLPGDANPVNGDFECPQYLTACTFRALIGASGFLLVGFDVAETFMTLLISGTSTFFYQASPACGTDLDNELTAKYVGGSAVITIPEVI